MTSAIVVDPHAKLPIMSAGSPLSRARLAVVMAHGRGASAADMISLADHLAIPDVAYLAPDALGHSWWPSSFLAPLAENEPGLTSALKAFESAIASVVEVGLPYERLVVLGFSQGACLALEHVARHGRRYHAAAGLSGALIGTSDIEGPAREELYGYRDKRFDYAPSLDFDKMPLLLGCHARDPHIPLSRVDASAGLFAATGANVTKQIYPGRGHGVVAEEVAWLRAILNKTI